MQDVINQLISEDSEVKEKLKAKILQEIEKVKVDFSATDKKEISNAIKEALMDQTYDFTESIVDELKEEFNTVFKKAIMSIFKSN